MPSEQNENPASGPGKGRVGKGENGLPSWLVWVLVAVVGLTVISALSLSSTAKEPIAYSQFVSQVDDGNIKTVVWNNVDQSITGTTLLVDGGQHLMKFERDFSLM